jgi:glutamine synthetase
MTPRGCGLWHRPLCRSLGLHRCDLGSGRGCGFRLDLITTEYDTPQFEFTLAFDEALRAVDDIVLFRQLAREVAIKRGVC